MWADLFTWPRLLWIPIFVPLVSEHAFWTSLLTSYPNALCLQLLVVSDLFTERTQFEMMYLTLTELRRVHPAEDEILIQYLVPATCKAAAVLGMVSERWCRDLLLLAACHGHSLGLERSDMGRMSGGFC